VGSRLTSRRPALVYWIASGRRIVLLTVSAKTRMREVGEGEAYEAARLAFGGGQSDMNAAVEPTSFS